MAESQIHEMLHARGANWTTGVSERFRNGTFLSRPAPGDDAIYKATGVLPTYAAVSGVIEPHLAREVSTRGGAT